MIPNYSMIPAAAIRWSPGIRWSPAIRWSPGIRWSIRSMDFDNRKVYGDTSITDGLVYLARQKTLSYQRCMKEVTHSQSTYIQQVGIGSCMYNVEPLYVSDRDIGNTVQDRGKTCSDAPFTHINFFPSITPCVARLPLCMKWTWLALFILQDRKRWAINAAWKRSHTHRVQ